MIISSSELVASGYLVKAKLPWKSGALRYVAKVLGKTYPADAMLVRNPPPWSKVRGWIYAMSEYQLQATLNFGELNSKLAEEYKNLPKGERLAKRLLDVGAQLKGRSYGRTPKPKAPALPKIRSLISGRVVTPTPARGQVIEEVV